MFCNKCGNKLNDNSKFCNICGAPINYAPVYSQYNNVNASFNPQKSNKFRNICIGLGVGSIGVIIVLVLAIFAGSSAYYFPGDENTPEIVEEPNDVGTSKSKYRTVIITDNTYEGVSIKGVKDAKDLISKDSTDQKSSCSKEIINIENEMIKKYDITAVNLCEMDVDFAKDLITVLEHIYKEYPEIKGYLTNITLWNTTMNENGIIAAYMPTFIFASSDTSTGYPLVVKMQVLLSSKFFLNKEKLDLTVKENSAIGHFPPNTNIYSPLAHEFGHYISFIAMINYYNVNSLLLIYDNSTDALARIMQDYNEGTYTLNMLEEAYNNYKKDTGDNIAFDDWRGTISKYALAKDNNGDYIYDETIAEAFHDVYLNSSNAKPASKYITAVLKERLKG